jgi:site-specific DNA-methyltransferase (adenine-specific)
VIHVDPDADYVVLGDCAKVLPALPDAAVQLIYIDPPFNTGKAQQRRTIATVRDAAGDRTGFQGRRYATTELGRQSYRDVHDDYLGLLEPLLREARRLLAPSGTFYLHIDYREAHYVKVLLDEVFGRDAFLNELIWAYDFGGRARDRWPAKHDTILVYVRTPGAHFFDQDAVERIPYLAPGLVGPDKAARGKLPTDVWWHTIVPTNGREKTGYPNQKPEGILRRIVQASSKPGDRVLDFFAGSGTTGAVAAQLGRRFVLIDNNPEAVEIMCNRLPSAHRINAEGSPTG